MRPARFSVQPCSCSGGDVGCWLVYGQVGDTGPDRKGGTMRARTRWYAPVYRFPTRAPPSTCPRCVLVRACTHWSVPPCRCCSSVVMCWLLGGWIGGAGPVRSGSLVRACTCPYVPLRLCRSSRPVPPAGAGTHPDMVSVLPGCCRWRVLVCWLVGGEVGGADAVHTWWAPSGGCPQHACRSCHVVAVVML